MKKIAQFALRNSMIIDVIGLLLSIVIVLLLYMFWLEPAALQTMFEAEATGSPPPRTIPILLKDPEQQICIILGIWCLWLWLFRYQIFMDEPELLRSDFLELQEHTTFDENVLHQIRNRLREYMQSLPHVQLLGSVETVIDSLEPDGTSSQFKDASEIGATSCDVYLEQLDSKLSITKYILWAIPSVGFLGTVRGIGEALGRADEALGGDISGVAESLGIAFNSTFCALFISLLLMLFSYLLQGREERLVADYKKFIATDLIGRLSALARAQRMTQSS